ncbi:MAG: hypothetical protein ACYDIA_16720 [Candidatus Humimicrobiaceae bacterium]
MDNEIKELVNMIIGIIEKDPDIKKDLQKINHIDRILICRK